MMLFLPYNSHVYKQKISDKTISKYLNYLSMIVFFPYAEIKNSHYDNTHHNNSNSIIDVCLFYNKDELLR